MVSWRAARSYRPRRGPADDAGACSRVTKVPQLGRIPASSAPLRASICPPFHAQVTQKLHGFWPGGTVLPSRGQNVPTMLVHAVASQKCRNWVAFLRPQHRFVHRSAPPISRTSYAQVAWFLAERHGLIAHGEAVPTMLVHAVASQKCRNWVAFLHPQHRFVHRSDPHFTHKSRTSCMVAGREGEGTAALLRLDRRRRLSGSAGASSPLINPTLYELRRSTSRTLRDRSRSHVVWHGPQIGIIVRLRSRNFANRDAAADVPFQTRQQFVR